MDKKIEKEIVNKTARLVTMQIIKNLSSEEAKQEVRQWAAVNGIDLTYKITDV